MRPDACFRIFTAGVNPSKGGHPKDKRCDPTGDLASQGWSYGREISAGRSCSENLI